MKRDIPKKLEINALEIIFKSYIRILIVKIFLIGGFGFIGKRFIRKFIDSHNIIVYATKNDIEQAEKDLDLTKIKIEEGVIEDEKLCSVIEKHNPNAVIHFAALTGLVKCYKNPKDAFTINVFGTYNVIKSCTNLSTKLIFISSREVYGETCNGVSNEEDTLLPNNVYGVTKMISEDIVKFGNKKYGLDYTILRLTNVYGPEGDQYGAQIIIKNAIKEKKIQVMGGKQRLNYIYVDDVVEIINESLKNIEFNNQIFNIGSEDTVTIHELVEKITSILDENILIEKLPMRETETTNFEPDITKISKILKHNQLTSIDEGLKKTIQWYKSLN